MARSLSQKIASSLIVAWMLLASLGGTFAIGAMMTHDSMHPCPFMGVPGLCSMTPLAHLSQWQETFASVAQQTSTIVLMLMLALAVAWQPIRGLYAPRPKGIPILRYRRRESFSDPLRLALARGIIHTKAF